MIGFWTELVSSLLIRFEWAVFFYFVLVNSFYALLLVSATWALRRHLLIEQAEPRWRILSSDMAPSISLLAPAYNEAATVAESVRSHLALYYPNLEVVVVNDGSKDDTLSVLVAEFELHPIHPVFHRQISVKPVRNLYRSRIHPNLVVVDKENGGKADALNAGLNFASGQLVCAMDADTLVEADALQRMVRPFLLSSVMVATGGTIRPVNGSLVDHGRVVHARAPRRMLPGVQVVEYLRSFLFGRLGWNRLGGNLIISGAFGLFRRDALVEGGGYTVDTVGEDIELVVRLRRYGYEKVGPHVVEFIPDPVAWTEVPETLRQLGRQRDRWHRGLADVMWRHRRLLFNPSYGALGLVVFPFFLFGELLAPVIEALGLVGLVVGLSAGVLNASFAGLFFLVAYGYGAILTLMTLVLEEWSFHRYETFSDRFWLVLWSLIENLGYRQLTVVWRLQGLLNYLQGRRHWGLMERQGFQGKGRLPLS